MDIMMRLKGAGFSAIANAFREREKRLGGGLPLLDFVEIVLPGLPKPNSAEEKAASVSALVDLFEDIDINGDGHMEFDEFTSFCVDAGMIATRTQVSTIKHRYERDTKQALKTTAASTSAANSNSHGSTTSISSVSSSPSMGIEKLRWSAGFRMFLVLENAARSVKLFTSEGKFVTEVSVGGDKQPQTGGSAALSTGTGTGVPMNDVLLVGDGVAFVTPTSVAPPSASSVSILDAVFIHRFQWLGISTSDFVISFYDMSDSRKVPTTTKSSSSSSKTFALLKHLELTTTTAQLTLRFCESSALLVGSGNDFVVNVWKVVDVETKILWRRLSSHADLVLDVLEIPVHDLLVSCDLKHNIQLWDITDGRPRGSLNAHERGVRQLCYSTHHDLLLSAGFEFEAFAWDLGSRQVALKLSGHRAPLIGVQLALFQTERAITGDCQGVFKVWDITRGNASSSVSSTSQAVQLESVDLGMPSVHVEPISFVSMHPYSRNLWVVTSGSCTLQHIRSVRAQQFEEVPLRAFYHYSANKFVVVAGSVCSLWDGETGSCCQEFTHVGNMSISATSKRAVGGSQGTTSKESSSSVTLSSSTAELPSPSDPATSASRSSAQSNYNEPGTELLTCGQDEKCRKLVVVSELGALGVFNCQNFVQMRQCPESFLSKPLKPSTTGKATPVVSSAPSCAVSGVHYCSENKLIIVTDAGTSAILVVDDNSNQDSSKGIGVLRRLVNIPGGISTSAYSFHASMIATVAAEPDGMTISLWDFETLTHQANCRYSQEGPTPMPTSKDGSTLTVQVLQFWAEFPVLLAGDSMGGVYFFAVMPLLHAYTGKLLHAFANDHAANTVLRRGRTRLKSSRSIQENLDEDGESDEDDGNSNGEAITDATENAARKLLSTRNFRKNALTAIPVLKPETETSTKAQSPIETSSAVTCMKVVFDEKSDRYLLFVGDEQGSVGVWDPAVMMRRLAVSKIPEIKSKHLRRGYQPKAMFYRDCLKETADADGSSSLPSQRDKHRQAVSHGTSNDWRGAMLLGEDMEHMNVRASHMDLKRLSRRRQESRAPRPTNTPNNGNNTTKLPAQQPQKSVRVKESAVVNAVAAAEFLLGKGSTFSTTKRKSVRGLSVNQAKGAPESTSSKSFWPGSVCYKAFPRDVTLVRRWQAHVDGVTSLEISRHPNILVTCGLDMRVFVWDWEGACLGKLFDPENQGSWPWRFRKDNATRSKEREILVRDLVQELERTPAEKMELRRQNLYTEHVGRRNVNDLRNVNAMLLEHIISKNPEIKLLEQEIKGKHEFAEAASMTMKTSKCLDSRTKAGTSRKLSLLPTETKAAPVTVTVNTPRQSLRLQSLSQVGPPLNEEVIGRKVSTIAGNSPSFLEPGDLKMDKAYLENELSITYPTTSSSLNANRFNRETTQQQIQAEYQIAQQAKSNRATLTRKAREMYSNMEDVRTRHKTRQRLASDGIAVGEDPLEASEFLKHHFSASTLAARPQTAPVRALTSSKSAGQIGLRRQKKIPLQRLQISVSEVALPSTETSPTNASFAPNAVGSTGSVRRRSSLDEIYMEEFHRHRQQQQHNKKERDLADSVPENIAVNGDKPALRPLHKLREINEIIDRVQGYTDGDQLRQNSRPGTAPVGSRRVSLLPAASDASLETSCEHFAHNVIVPEANTEELRKHLEDTKHRMQEALREDKVPHRQNLRRLRQQALQQQQQKRMNSYLQQKHRELTTNVANVFKGLQTTQTLNGIGEETSDSGHQSSGTQHRSSTTGLLKTRKAANPKLLSAKKKTFGMYNVQEVMSVIRLFSSMDADGSGNITLVELQRFKPMFEKLGFPNLVTIFQTIDADGDGQLTLRELLTTCFQYATKGQIESMLQLAKVGSVRTFLFGANTVDKTSNSTNNPFASAGELLPEHRQELMAIFRIFDHNGDGGVSMQEIMEALRVDDDDVMATVMTREHDKTGGRSSEPVVSSGLTREDVEQLYKEFDRNQSATLDFDEFVGVMASLYGHKPNFR